MSTFKTQRGDECFGGSDCIIPYEPTCQFSIHNLPYGVFSTRNNPEHRIGVAIGDKVLDLRAVSHLLKGPIIGSKVSEVFSESTLNAFMELSPECWHEVRQRLQDLLSISNPTLISNSELMKKAFTNIKDVMLHLPFKVSEYTDFLSNIQHTENCGSIFFGEKTLPPAFLYLPIAYHGRASSVVVSGTPIRRPNGLAKPDRNSPPVFGSSTKFDFELELGAVIGGATNQFGSPIPVNSADKNIFGFILLNDWSARDIQMFEIQPLGPFTSKNVGTTISPWVVTYEALKPFIVPRDRPQEPQPAQYLCHNDPFSFNINLEVQLKPSNFSRPVIISKSNAKYQYWTMRQMIAHHTITGCPLHAGDILGSGTISGTTEDSFGCLLELSWNGQKPLTLVDFGNENKATRTFLEDGDEVIFNGIAEGILDGKLYRVGFGNACGRILPALDASF